MKKLYFVLIALLVINSVNVFSQRGTTIGINGSYNSTWILWPNDYGIKEFINTKTSYYVPSYGYDIALSLGHNFVKVLGIKAEIGLNSLNQKYKNTVDNTTRDLNLKYMEIPVMLRLATPGKHFVIHLMAGPQFGILMSANQTNITVNGADVNTLGSYYKNFQTKDIKDRYNHNDLMGIVDLGFDVFLSEKVLLNVGFRIHGSSKDINKTDWQIFSRDVDYFSSRNVYGGVNIGLTWALNNWYNQK